MIKINTGHYRCDFLRRVFNVYRVTCVEGVRVRSRWRYVIGDHTVGRPSKTFTTRKDAIHAAHGVIIEINSNPTGD